MWGIHRSPVNSPYKDKRRGALMFYMTCAWINAWINSREAGGLIRHRAHYDAIVMDPRHLSVHVVICITNIDFHPTVSLHHWIRTKEDTLPFTTLQSIGWLSFLWIVRVHWFQMPHTSLVFSFYFRQLIWFLAKYRYMTHCGHRSVAENDGWASVKTTSIWNESTEVLCRK